MEQHIASTRELGQPTPKLAFPLPQAALHLADSCSDVRPSLPLPKRILAQLDEDALTPYLDGGQPVGARGRQWRYALIPTRRRARGWSCRAA